MIKLSGVTLSGFLVVAAIGAMTNGAFASKDDAARGDTFTVGVRVNKGCSVTSPGDFSFGAYDQTPWTAKQIQGSLTVTCTSGTEFALSFDSYRESGAFADGTRRYMRNASGDKILYYIRKSGNLGSVSTAYGFSTGPDSGKFIFTSVGDPIPIPFYLTIDKNGWVGAPGNPLPPPKSGYYSDNVTANVEF